MSARIAYVISALSWLLLFLTPRLEATNRLDGTVLGLTYQTPGQAIQIEWQSENGESSREPRFTQKGYHLYETRNNPNWKGLTRSVTVDGVPVPASAFVHPTVRDEAALFLTPEPWTPSTICYLYGHTLGGISWEIILFGLFLIFAGLLIYKRKGVAMALFASLIVVSVIADFRTDYDHAAIVSTARDNPLLGGANDIRTACDLAANRMNGRTWTSQGLWTMLDNVVAYRLAETRYVPTESNADFVVTFSDRTLNFKPPQTR